MYDYQLCVDLAQQSQAQDNKNTKNTILLIKYEKTVDNLRNMKIFLSTAALRKSKQNHGSYLAVSRQSHSSLFISFVLVKVSRCYSGKEMTTFAR